MATTTITTAANALRNQYLSTFAPAATEEQVITKNWFQPAEKIGNLLNMRKIAAPTATTTAVSTAMGSTGLSYSSSLETVVQLLPQNAYSAVELTRQVLLRIVDDADYKAKLRSLLAAVLMQQVDSSGGLLAAQLSNVKGSAGDTLTKGLILDGLGTIAKNAKNQWKKGSTPVYLCFHPDQLKYVLSIPDITSANLRGDSQKPNVSGFVWDAWGMRLDESGNIFQSAGVTHNMLELEMCHALGYGEEPHVLEPQIVELVVRLIGFTEFGNVEYFDEYGVDLQTAVG